MRYIVATVIIFLVVFFGTILLLLAAGIGIGWVLTRFLPMDLGDASLLGVIAVIVATTVLYRVFLKRPSPDEYEAFLEDEWKDGEMDLISPSRFIEDDGRATYEAWLNYVFANAIYGEFLESDDVLVSMNDMQQRELAIRLAGVAVEILKSKPSSTRRIRITPEQFRKKMVKMGLRPYDDDIIELALAGTEKQIEFSYDEIVSIIRDRSWKRISPMQ